MYVISTTFELIFLLAALIHWEIWESRNIMYVAKQRVKFALLRHVFCAVNFFCCGSRYIKSFIISYTVHHKHVILTMALPIMGFDCTMIGAGRRGGREVAGRVAVVDETGKCVYDVLVKHKLRIKDYRTPNTGITAENINNNGITYKKVKNDVASWIRHRILVGTDLNKLKVLGLSHPDWNRRDISEYHRFRAGNTIPTLSNLAATHLGVAIQNHGIQLPHVNAIIAVRLYKKYQNEWDEQVEQEYADSDEEMSGEEQSDEEMSGGEQSDEEQSYEEQSDEEQSDEEMSEEESEYSSEDDE